METLSRRSLLKKGLYAGATLVGSQLAFGALKSWSSVAAQAAQEVTFWHVWGGVRTPLIEEIIRDFEEKHPGIVIRHTTLANAGYEEKTITAITGGVPPECLMVRAQILPNFVQNNFLLPLGSFAEQDGLDYEKTFIRADAESCMFDGQPYALPNTTGGAQFLLFYNKQHFREAGLDPERPPQTWQELVEAAERLTVIQGGRAERVGFNIGQDGLSSRLAFAAWLYTNNGSLFSDDGREVAFAGSEGLETLEWMVEVARRTGGWELANATTGMDIGSFRAAFWQGKVSMALGGTWLFEMIEQGAPNLDYGVGRIPYNGNNPKAASVEWTLGPWTVAIPRRTRHPEAAWRWLKYFTVDEGALKFFKAQRRPLPVRAHNEDPFFSESNPFWNMVIESVENARFVRVGPQWGRIEEALRTMQDDVLLGNRRPQEALRQTADAVQRLLDRERRS